MLDLLPFKRSSGAPDVLSEMDEMVKRMWYGFPFHNPKIRESRKKVAQIAIK